MNSKVKPSRILLGCFLLQAMALNGNEWQSLPMVAEWQRMTKIGFDRQRSLRLLNGNLGNFEKLENLMSLAKPLNSLISLYSLI